ncbi:MAG: DNA-3-methyladenine glycosylase [Pirellulales bacterium]
MPFIAQQVKSARLHLQKSDPVMKVLLNHHGPFTAKAKTDRFGTLVSSIISQQISTAAAATIKLRLHQAIMDKAKVNKLPTLTAEHLQQFDLDSFRELGISRQKATYLLDLADKVGAGVVELHKMGRMSDDEIIEQLIQIKGIGRWTAQMFLIFSMARMDVLPVDDLGIKNAVQRQYGLEQLPNASQIEQLAEPWRPYATIASWYLWRSLEG